MGEELIGAQSFHRTSVIIDPAILADQDDVIEGRRAQDIGKISRVYLIRGHARLIAARLNIDHHLGVEKEVGNATRRLQRGTLQVALVLIHDALLGSDQEHEERENDDDDCTNGSNDTIARH